ncbi:MAG: sulfite exporter TauE/SafE family protein [Acidimicrobiales bacterium]|nr:sulfite exporter TauE/SafE family protein [Acidimicrobiales bacterium]
MKGLVASPLGFLIGFALGALGGGGSILAVPVLVYAAGQTPAAATTTSLLIVAGASGFGLVGHWRAGRVKVRSGIVFGLVGIAGSFVGTALNRRVDGDLLLLAFSGLILVAAWRMLTRCPTCTRVGEEEVVGGDADTKVVAPAGQRKKLITVVAAGTGVGFLTGLFGVGGGFVIVPALTLALGFAMPEAIGTSLLVIIINAAVALAARGGPGAVEWDIAIPFTVAAMIGVAAGVRAADRLPAESLLRAFAALLVAVGFYTAISSVLAL